MGIAGRARLEIGELLGLLNQWLMLAIGGHDVELRQKVAEVDGRVA
jgi:hypothetical protein